MAPEVSCYLGLFNGSLPVCATVHLIQFLFRMHCQRERKEDLCSLHSFPFTYTTLFFLNRHSFVWWLAIFKFTGECGWKKKEKRWISRVLVTESLSPQQTLDWITESRTALFLKRSPLFFVLHCPSLCSVFTHLRVQKKQVSNSDRESAAQAQAVLARTGRAFSPWVHGTESHSRDLWRWPTHVIRQHEPLP